LRKALSLILTVGAGVLVMASLLASVRRYAWDPGMRHLTDPDAVLVGSVFGASGLVCAVLGLAVFPKEARGKKALYMIGGLIALVALARLVAIFWLSRAAGPP
jgi:hypothetical protein